MKVIQLQLTEPILIGNKTERYIGHNSEVFRLYDVDFDKVARLMTVKHKTAENVPAIVIPIENVSAFSLSEEKKTEASNKKVSVNGGTKKE